MLDAIYAAFAEGWSDPAGTETRRRNLAAEGIWLGRLVASLMPDEPEALGLLALMLYAEARRAGATRMRRRLRAAWPSRTPALWDAALIDEAEALLRRASAMGRDRPLPARGGGAVGACVRRRATGATDWAAIAAALRCAGRADRLARWSRSTARSPSGKRRAPRAGLAALGQVADDARLADYQPYWAARAGLLARLGHRRSRPTGPIERAIGLERDAAVRRFLEARRADLAIQPSPSNSAVDR